MGLTTFCGILTIQVGVTVLAAVLLTLGAVILVANILEGLSDDEEGGSGGKEDDSNTNYTIIFIMAFAISLFIIGGLAFLSAYTESKTFAMLALLGLILLTAFWIVMCVLSFKGKKETAETVCRTPKDAKKALRCPESLWLADLDYKKDGGGGRKFKREINYKLEDFVGSKLMSESSFTAEIHQILIELRKLNLCLKFCCKENCLKNRKEDNDYCKLCGIFNSKILKIGLIEANKSQNKSFPSVNGSNELQFNFLQNYSMDLLPGIFGKLVTSRFGVTVPYAYLPLNLNKIDDKRQKSTDKTITENEKRKFKEIITVDENNQAEDFKTDDEENEDEEIEVGDEGSSFGKPMMAALALFIANLVFFLFTALMLWSWAKELGDDCYVDEICYY